VSVRERLVVASASPRRRDLLVAAGHRFRVRPADVDETPPSGLPPAEAAVEVARRKALAVAPGAGGSVVLAADTIVVTPRGEVLGKPDNPDHARRMLRRLSGTRHCVVTGVFIIDTATGAQVSRAVTTGIVFGAMSDEEIDRYVDSGEAMGKAGAYAIQETGDRFVRQVQGSFSNVVGLPMEALEEMLDELERACASDEFRRKRRVR